MSELLSQGFQLMTYGLVSVFTVLILFIGTIVAMVKIFSYVEDKKAEKTADSPTDNQQ